MKAPLAWAFQKDSQFVDCFNYHLRKIKESGVITQIVVRTQEINEKYNTVDDAFTLTFENVVFPYLIMVAGVITSVCQSAMEKIWFKVKGKLVKPATSLRAAFTESTSRSARRKMVPLPLD